MLYYNLLIFALVFLASFVASSSSLSKKVMVFANDDTKNGVPAIIEAEFAADFDGLVRRLSSLVRVRHAGKPNVQVGRVVTSGGKHVRSYEDIEDGDQLHLIPEGLHFVWPYHEFGHKVEMDPEVVAPPTQQPIVLESINESPRVFRIHNFFTEEEADALIAHIESITDPEWRLQRSSVGPATELDKRQYSQVRTSENAFDSSSPTAARLIRRGFELLRMEYVEGQADGLQLVKYEQERLYKAHTDYFPPNADADFNWVPKEGGANRFATIFMYVSDVEMGGQTGFPMAEPLPSQNTTVPWEAAALFKEETWQYQMVQQCYQRLSVTPRKGDAVLFYSQRSDGEMDPRSVHGGCPVVKGVKWGANLWVWNDIRHGMPRPDDTTKVGAGGEEEVEEDKPVEIVFLNSMDRNIELMWTMKSMGVMKPGQKLGFRTYSGNRWHAHYEGESAGADRWSLMVTEEMVGRKGIKVEILFQGDYFDKDEL